MKRTLLLLVCAFLLTGYLTDSSVHTPPTSGTYDYNAWMPGAGGFPGVGGSYVDPVFGGTVRRLTDAYTTSQANGEQIYAKHHANANGTYSFSTQFRGGVYTQLFILDTVTGNEVYTTQPAGDLNTNIAWHPTDPDKYYFMEGAVLKRRNLAAQTTTTIKTFAATLQTLGGSVDWIDRTGRYFVIKYSDLVRVWDSTEDAVYSGAFTQLAVDQWVGITPDGNYLVDVSGATATPNQENYSRLLNHGANSIGSPVQFWGLGGSHAALVSASDGKSYWVGFNSHDSDGANGGSDVWRVDITLNQAGRTAAQQRADNLRLIETTYDSSGHFSAVSVGPLADWVFYDDELIPDAFDDAPSGPWPAYAQEIIAVNVITGEIRRLAHHRSRGISGSYFYEGRISTSWDGSAVLWTSNFNRSSPADYSDLYVINNPLAGDSSFFRRRGAS